MIKLNRNNLIKLALVSALLLPVMSFAQDGTDSDKDGFFDTQDNCSAVANADQLDSDSDGYGDSCDAFPTNAAVAVDVDGDGYADSYNVNCDAACQARANVRIDAFPADRTRFEAPPVGRR